MGKSGAKKWIYQNGIRNLSILCIELWLSLYKEFLSDSIFA
ncbi:hypothetical protein LEP1GSC074_3089 [Leptospira noguchii str. Hook]|uniref:Uncharacterized protein n=1 Tax=Leptospira noguchii str. 2001034031 TaxID=1193053 RepID=M6YBV6_9LEPT|nr:hypothetical protein LEP1GSC041_0475 [Leptospira noguchii str. 2006001870]EMO26475.1 hypothetical protein LEP1GSC170_1980 [Leptospira interrogans serovar Bataviae str. HAI135]EMO87114.1 hypothetical protein LEP1GSC024_0624 [Leptospira noguchii str. 2001034031]EMS88541.1 hypothetical protein LEP1GSC074_3089 [Leptospira noguchii str. Hook]